VSVIDLEVTWRTNARGSNEPPLQIHRVNESTIILRQSLAVTFEAPFLYLLLGRTHALLLDTGATAAGDRFPLRATIDGLVDAWLAAHPCPGYELIVAHSHAHGDHIMGDSQLVDRPNTVIVRHDASSVANFFGITGAQGEIDLGDRRLLVLAIPGHEPASIALWDEQTALLLTGDTVYPGRIYVRDPAAFASSMEVLCAFADTHPVSAILGAHVEATGRPRLDVPLGSIRHPREAPLPMTVAQLRAMRDATVSLDGRPGAHRFDDFALWIRPHRRALVVQAVRLVLARITGRG
jgi:hydroxyacylglutathione hydrolase